MSFSFIALFILALFLALRIFTLPIRLAWKLLINAISGFFLLFIVNLFGAGLGLFVPITFITASIAGLCGIPGAIVMLMAKILGIW